MTCPNTNQMGKQRDRASIQRAPRVRQRTHPPSVRNPEADFPDEILPTPPPVSMRVPSFLGGEIGSEIAGRACVASYSPRVPHLSGGQFRFYTQGIS